MVFFKKILILFLLVSGPLFADTLLNRAIQAEREKKYPEAIELYQQTLKENPNDARPFRGLGNCYYFQGNPDAALLAYNEYLKAYPSDFQIKAFVNKLGGAPETDKTEEIVRRKKKKERVKVEAIDPYGKFFFGGSLGYGLYSMTEFKSALGADSHQTGSGTYSKNSTAPSSGVEFSVFANYGITRAFGIGLDLEYWLASGTQNISSTGSGTSSLSTTFNENVLFVGPSASFHQSLRPRLSLGISVQPGWLTLYGAGTSGSYSSTGSGTYSETFSSTHNGSAFGIQGFIDLTFDWKSHLNVSLGIGGRSAKISEVTQTRTAGTLPYNGPVIDPVTKNKVPLDYSGGTFKVSVAYVF